jgi:AbrB family looped-hinge helix DNA binding protein
MDALARIDSKGRVTVPGSVRDALGLKLGDTVVFRLAENRAVLARTPDFLELAGAVSVPRAMQGAPWSEIRKRARVARARSRSV